MFIASRPRRRWQVIRVNSGVEALCNQCSVPCTRNPVSSKCASCAPAMRVATWSVNAPRSSPAAAVAADTVPSETGVENNSDSALAVRDRDRYWPMYRYTMTARIRGPYWTGAPTPAGAPAVLMRPHGQRRAMSWCSVTRIFIGGRSNTCRRVAPTSVPSRASAPQPPQQAGSWRMTSSGSDTCSRVRPRRPGCPPGRRPVFLRSDFGAGLANPSLDGGFEEFREFAASCRSSSAIRAS